MHDITRAAPPSLGRGALWPGLAAAMALALAMLTLQVQVNGSTSPYATDVGEIQNALPRWGTLHFIGYPLYSMTGSLLVTLLRLVGVAPAAAGGALVAAVSLSAWIDASIAEVHTMTMALTVASLLMALRYRRSGARADLLWLTFAFTQGVAHQRAVAFLVPAIALLAAPRWRQAIGAAGHVVAVALLAPLTYLYLPMRYWQGADWTFGQPGTWHGFWTMVADTKAERILAAPATFGEWWARGLTIVRLVGDDLPLPLMALGLAGLWALPRRRRGESAALTLAWLPYLALCVVIWEGDVSDALLAVKLPLPFMAGVGLALIAGRVGARRRAMYPGGLVVLAVVIALPAVQHRPRVLAITRDRTATAIVDTVGALEPPDDGPTTLLALWGHEYWALRYAQAYEGRFSFLNLVDHNADVRAIAAAGHRLWTPATTFYRLPPSWWEERLAGDVHLSSVRPGIVEVSTRPAEAWDVNAGTALDLGNGVRIASASLNRDDGRLVLTVYWAATEPPARDYRVGVHVLTDAEPDGAEDVAAQADQRHPVGGWYPTSRWRRGEVVRDHYVLPVPAGVSPVGVRVGMYYQDSDGSFVNSPWLFLPW